MLDTRVVCGASRVGCEESSEEACAESYETCCGLMRHDARSLMRSQACDTLRLGLSRVSHRGEATQQQRAEASGTSKGGNTTEERQQQRGEARQQQRGERTSKGGNCFVASGRHANKACRQGQRGAQNKEITGAKGRAARATFRCPLSSLARHARIRLPSHSYRMTPTCTSKGMPVRTIPNGAQRH